MVVLKRVGVLKAACFMGLYGLFMGIIFDLFLMIYMFILSSILPTGSLGLMGLGTGLLSFILIPLIYGVLSFLLGFIFTPLMNLVLRIIKGLDLDMVE
jgi:hypothetical protein